MAKRKTATAAQLVDWRIGHHIEAAGTTIAEPLHRIAEALHRIADQMERDHELKGVEIGLRKQHLISVLESKATADKAAERLLGLIPDVRRPDRHSQRHDLRDLHDLRDVVEASERGPEWVKDVLKDEQPS